MIRTKHLTTAAAATTMLAAFPAGASAHHFVSHTVSAVQQDVQAATQLAEQQVSSARRAIDDTGAHTRRVVADTVAAQGRSAQSRVQRTASSAGATAEAARERVKARTAPVVAHGQRRVASVRNQADNSIASTRRSAERTSAKAQERVGQVQAAAGREVQRSRMVLRQQYALAERRASALTYRITRELDLVLAGGSMTLSTGAGDVSLGWTRSGGCWGIGATTPFSPLSGRTKRRTGVSAEAVEGGRVSAETAQGNAAASVGC